MADFLEFDELRSLFPRCIPKDIVNLVDYYLYKGYKQPKNILKLLADIVSVIDASSDMDKGLQHIENIYTTKFGIGKIGFLKNQGVKYFQLVNSGKLVTEAIDKIIINVVNDIYPCRPGEKVDWEIRDIIETCIRKTLILDEDCKSLEEKYAFFEQEINNMAKDYYRMEIPWSMTYEGPEGDKIKNYLKGKGYTSIYYPVYGSVHFAVHKNECDQIEQSINLTSLPFMFVQSWPLISS